jgi:hypothetical protein
VNDIIRLPASPQAAEYLVYHTRRLGLAGDQAALILDKIQPGAG